jgi:hypothetical protein
MTTTYMALTHGVLTQGLQLLWLSTSPNSTPEEYHSNTEKRLKFSLKKILSHDI